MSKDATEQLALVRSFLVSPELFVTDEVHQYRVGGSLPNLESSAEYRRAFIHDITIAVAPKQPIELEQLKLNQFFAEVIDLRGSQRYFSGGVGHHNGAPYYLTTMVGTHWLYGKTDKTVKLKQEVEIEDEELKAQVKPEQISLISEQRLPFQQAITLYELPTPELAQLWADMVALPNAKHLFPDFSLVELNKKQVQMLHQGQDPFAELKRKLAALKNPKS